jgi:hypothetical protein
MGDGRDARGRLEGLTPDAAPGLTRPCCPAKLVEVFNAGHMPTDLPGVFACRAVTPGGAESEGAAVSGAGDPARPLFVTVYGSAAPHAGDQFVARLVRGRWVAGRGGTPPGHPLAPCGCGKIPDVLYMVVPDPSLYGGMFDPATILRQSAPQWAVDQHLVTDVAADGSKNTRLSTAVFTRSQPNNLGTSLPPLVYQYRWWFGCVVGFGFSVKRGFLPQTLTGSLALQYQALIAAETPKFSWLAGFAGNTCAPFRMVTGQQHAESPPSVSSSVQVRDAPP